jgi:hypothetical protein
MIEAMPRTIATNTPADREALLDFVRPRHHVIVIMTRADGTPQASRFPARLADD